MVVELVVASRLLACRRDEEPGNKVRGITLHQPVMAKLHSMALG